ncbi:hypothetical protein CWI42_020250 [Ordospora colligata]|uniref:PH domain-containing protein n=1 Tax=Ordospora colligata OC4 TaxID=1354746 RepID=A0A0B2UMB8_9MICR|nr:uncharacterized protein M896_020260 [Ordospora colligata OC4]KHN70192.1 hypothetical protein M896_020260 [Ordospora colligata OC4]TBU16736.1 hypothetical protein CWI41_020270 [Ordospora colligata]TBU17042.1 hypothetical protein CWI40_020270 [Ordospora colligata]TBU19466.1 hypothetical protein CWI42_020250 [Ordospora colligata]
MTEASNSDTSLNKGSMPGGFKVRTGIPIGSMDEKLRRINEEFKSRACAGSGFVFNNNVKLKPPKSYFGNDVNESESELSRSECDTQPTRSSEGSGVKQRDGFVGGVIPWKTGSSSFMMSGIAKDGKPGMLGIDLYKKHATEPSRSCVSMCESGTSIESKPRSGYVKSVVDSTMFNKEASFNYTQHFGRNASAVSIDGMEMSGMSSIMTNGSLLSSRVFSAHDKSIGHKPHASFGMNNSQMYTSNPKQLLSSTEDMAGSPTFAPIDVMYVKSMCGPKTDTESNASRESRDSVGVQREIILEEPPLQLYAPGKRLTIHPRIKILNTVLNYEGTVETTQYYILIESDVSWCVCKSLGEILGIVPEVECSTLTNAHSPQSRAVRDRIIQATLNSRSMNKQMQSFILSGIVDAQEQRSSYLLMDSNGWKAYIFKFVGKALICYEKNKVFKILLLSGCSVVPTGSNGFRLEKSKESIELYTTCKKERDSWMSDIREYIYKLQ